MKRIQLWADLLKQIQNEVLSGITPESTYYHYCSKFMTDILPD